MNHTPLLARLEYLRLLLPMLLLMLLLGGPYSGQAHARAIDQGVPAIDSALAGDRSSTSSSAYASIQGSSAEEGASVLPEAIESASHPSWFSTESDSFRYPSVPSGYTRDSISDRSKIVAQPRANARWGNLFPTGFWEYFSITIVLIILAVILASLLYFFWSTSEAWIGRRGTLAKTTRAHRPATISDLPFAVDATPMGMLEAARFSMQKEDYSKAIIYLFSHILLELDSHQRIRLQRGKTNGMYLGEVQAFRPLYSIVYRIARRFEQAFFGNYRLTKEQFMECWNSIPEFDQLVRQPLESTSNVPIRASKPASPSPPLSQEVG